MYFSKEEVEKLLHVNELVDQGNKSQYSYFRRFASIIAYGKNQELHGDAIKTLRQYIKQKTGLFSPFRNNPFMLAALTTIKYKKPQQAIDRMLDHYEHLVQAGFKKKSHVPMLAYCLDSLLFDDMHYDQMKQRGSYIDELMEKSYKTYRQMKENHPWITGGDDYSLALLITYNEKSMDTVEQIYEALNKLGLKKGNDLQSLANVLSLSNEDPDVLCHRVSDMIDYSKEHAYKVNRSMYTGIGLIALLGEGYSYLDQVIEAAGELKMIKPYKWMDKNLLFMFSVSLVASKVNQTLSGREAVNVAISISIEQLIEAEVAVMIAAITASTAAATAAN